MKKILDQSIFAKLLTKKIIYETKNNLRIRKNPI